VTSVFPVADFRAPTAAARFTLIFIVALVSACESTPEVVPVDDPERVWAEHQARLATIVQWSAVGKLGIQSSQDSWSAGLSWHQDGDSYRLRLSGPLGQGLMELRGSPDAVELRTSDDEVYRARTAEDLMQTHAGWQVPLSGLRYWILGRPDPETEIVGFDLDAGGRLAELRQLGWHIRYERYAEFDGIVLPTRLTLENSRLRTKLVIRSWQTAPGKT
jgi:outer membrane lipoprotein LolB